MIPQTLKFFLTAVLMLAGAAGGLGEGTQAVEKYKQELQKENAKVKELLEKAAYCVAYVCGEDDRQAIFKADGSVDVKLLTKKVKNQKQLEKAQMTEVLNKAFAGTGCRPIAECFEPHHYFVFYDSESKPVGRIDLCLTCSRIKVSPDGADTRSWDGTQETADLGGLAAIVAGAGLPLTPYQSLEDYREKKLKK